MPGNSDDLVRVFYLTGMPTVKDFQDAAMRIRSATNVYKLFTYNALRAMAMRGSADQIALAEQLVQQRTK